MTEPAAEVIVVGGAVAGASLANALGSQGIHTLVLEKVSREVHSTRGDLLHPPSLQILDRWGVLQALHADGALPITEMGVSTPQGMCARFPVAAAADGPAGRTLAVPHDRIESVLFACAEGWPSVSSLRGTVTGLERDGARVAGVRFRAHGSREETVLRACVVVGCDGAQSLIRRSLSIPCEQHPYAHEQVIIGGEGETEPPAALHWYVDAVGPLSVISRPLRGFRILLPATGMSLAIAGASRLADLLAPALPTGSAQAVDNALDSYDAERRPAARAAIASNHAQALRLWQSDLYRSPNDYARAVDPSSAWGAGGTSWGQDPAGLKLASPLG